MVIELKDDAEKGIWQIILDAYGHDEDTVYFLLECREKGALSWALQRAINVESDLVFKKYKQGANISEGLINDAMIIRRVLGLIVHGVDSGKYLGNGDDRLWTKKMTS